MPALRTFILLLLTGLISLANGQTDGSDPVNDKIILSFNQEEFGDRLSVLYDSDNHWDYYVVDLIKIGGRFERVYFMSLTYEDRRIVNVDPEIEKGQIWFKAYYTYTEEEITCLFRDLKEKTDEASRQMTPEEQSDWLVRFDKFKQAD
jgi:hypothetical protein